MEFAIFVAPVTKKNHQQIMKCGNRRWIGPSAQYKRFETACGYAISQNVKKRIDFPVNVRARFYVATRRIVDLTNLLEAIDNVIVKYGVLKDDNANIIQGHDGSRVYVDRKNPRIELEILPIHVYDVYNRCTQIDEPGKQRY